MKNKTISTEDRNGAKMLGIFADHSTSWGILENTIKQDNKINMLILDLEIHNMYVKK